MSEHAIARLKDRHADLMARYRSMQRMAYVASAAALLQQAWAVEARLNAAGVWL